MSKKMKGVILAGGSGTRLFPNTKVTNKHLLPVYNQPMIYYPIQVLLKAGVNDILILPGKEHAGDFAKLLGSGREFNANFTFKIQDYAGGLAYATGLARDFVGDDNFVMVLGDNVLEDNIIEDVQNFESGAKIFLKKVSNPKRFGVAELEGNKVIAIEEKPKNPKSNWAAIGVYIFDSKAFEYIDTLKPSDRGELEITDLNNVYVQKGKMKAGFIKGYWHDTGTNESLVDAAYDIKNIDRPVMPLKIGEKNSPTVVLGGVLYDTKDGKYRTSKYLDVFLESVARQDYSNLKLIFADNSYKRENDNVKIIKEKFPSAEIIYTGSNLGFAKANNLIIRRAREISADYFMALNIDMMLEQNFVSEMVNVMLKNPQSGSATGKIKRWDFVNKNNNNKGKTNYIDSAGIEITKEHRFIDRGQGEIDHGQYDYEEKIFGPSGAAGIYKMEDLEDVAYINDENIKEYFDELMFMYKEDVDLAYRLQLAGYKSMYTPLAVVHHDRSLSRVGKGIIGIVRGRLGRKKRYREWSWLNHHIILQKVAGLKYSKDAKWKTRLFGFKSFGATVPTLGLFSKKSNCNFSFNLSCQRSSLSNIATYLPNTYGQALFLASEIYLDFLIFIYLIIAFVKKLFTRFSVLSVEASSIIINSKLLNF
jgi:glucose-1-phosphate thymidylyltransferase